MLLSILIATVEIRKEVFKKLEFELFRQNVYDDVEVIVLSDNKEISIGAKRQKLLEMAKGDWIVFFDDDDQPCEHYIDLIRSFALTHKECDCMGIRGVMTTNGDNPQTWCHRLGFPIKGNGRGLLQEYGFHFVRPIIHFNPVRRELALQAGFKDLRYGEDMDYASRLNTLLKKEVFIDYELFHYQYDDTVPHKEKYGL